MKRNRPLVCGVGKIDVDYPVALNSKAGGKWKVTWQCPFYTRWQHMLIRCYSESHQKAHPAYVGSSVDERWFSLTSFIEWAKDKYSEGLALDKDILIKGNKVYSPEACCFVPSYINNLLLIRQSKRGDCPLGVTRSGHRFQAFCRGAEKENLGRYATPEEAHSVWQSNKIDRMRGVLQRYKTEVFYDEAVYNALCLRITNLEEELSCKKETLSL